MNIIGIICEYNPFHLGHLGHIEKTKQIIKHNSSDEVAIVGIMSGNFVQRGDFAVFNKHARAKMAVSCGVDLVIEIPTPYVLQSAEGFATAGVSILDSLGICSHISFGSESGNIKALNEAAELITSKKANQITKEWLDKGLSYASAGQKAADYLMGKKSDIFKSPNNVLGIEYLKALKKLNSSIKPITVKRTGGEHDSDSGYSASALRKSFLGGSIPEKQMHSTSVEICIDETAHGRGPVSIKNAELAILSRLRMLSDFSQISGTSEGLDKRLKKYVSSETSIESILKQTKSKRYTMSRLRRVLLCAALGIKKEDAAIHPPYIRVLAMNDKGKVLLSAAQKTANKPVIIKPASAKKLNEPAKNVFELEVMATGLYVLAYQNENERKGGCEWRTSPVIV